MAEGDISMIARAILGVAVAAGLSRLLASDAGGKKRKRAAAPAAETRPAGTARSQGSSSKPRRASAKTVKSRTARKPVRKK
jgi:hypothetical protein